MGSESGMRNPGIRRMVIGSESAGWVHDGPCRYAESRQTLGTKCIHVLEATKHSSYHHRMIFSITRGEARD
jgi:hypothetical protein